jgi:hypothetical protein
MRRTVSGLLMLLALAGRPGTAAEPTAAVNADSLESMVRFLSIDPATGEARSRFVLRTADIGVTADSLAARLARYTGRAVDRVPFTFTETFYSGGGSFTGENIVARIEGTGAADGVVLVTGHYDAIAARMPEFRDDWRTMSAPGADDNGTGAAAVMELARVLPHGYYPFDILFVLFSAEELGKIGSADFAARFETLYGERILGVVNFDMLGYLPPPVGGEEPPPVIISNIVSAWLADMIGRSAEGADAPVRFRAAVPGPSNYDHGSFWEHQVPAVSITEPLDDDNFILYPYYHTTQDVIESGLDFDRAAELANAAEAFLSGIMEPGGAEIAILPSDLMLMRGPYPTGSRTFASGETLGVFVRVRNVGCGTLPAGAVIDLAVTIENAAGERSLFAGNVPGPGPLMSSDVVIRIELDDSFAGANVVHARVAVAGAADVEGNDAADVNLGVSAKKGLILSHGFRPNPVSGSIRGASFCVNLAREADLEVELYTIEGERVAAGRAGARWGTSAPGAGLTCLSCAVLFPTLDKLASGIYLYRLRMIEPNGGVARATGRFAVAR